MGGFAGSICDNDITGCPPILAKGVVYATNTDTNQVALSVISGEIDYHEAKIRQLEKEKLDLENLIHDTR